MKASKFQFNKVGKKKFLSQVTEVKPVDHLESPGPNIHVVGLDEPKQVIEPKKEKKNRILGTADYMAPEVIKGEEVNYMLDFWSLGIIAYEFMTGNLPFNDESWEKIRDHILHQEIEWPEAGTGENQFDPVALDFL